MRREGLRHLGGKSLEDCVGHEQVLLRRNPVLEQPVGDDHVGAVQLLDGAETLPREPAMVDDELQLEDADGRACGAWARGDRLHVA